MSTKKILIVDDSKVIQKLLFTILSKESDFEIVGICSDPFEAKNYISVGNVDCIILDLEMPKMDGLTFLKKLMLSNPIQTIILSAAVETNPALVKKLMSSGAHAVFSKPQGFDDQTFTELKKSIRETYKTYLQTQLNDEKQNLPQNYILIASSTGGTEGVKKILRSLENLNTTAVVVVQHMAEKFTKTFAETLDKVSEFTVSEIIDNEPLYAGHAYVAPGNFHSEIKASGSINQFKFRLQNSPHVHSVRPAADVTFLNIPQAVASKSIVVILSGMGVDGAQGLKNLKQLGAATIAESESSCVVFGMPKAAIKTGCVDHVLSIEEICDFLQNKYGSDVKVA